MQITEEARRTASIAVAVEVNSWPVDAGLPYHPADPTVADTMRRITDVVLEAAAPLLAPQSAVDREALVFAQAIRSDLADWTEEECRRFLGQFADAVLPTGSAK